MGYNVMGQADSTFTFGKAGSDTTCQFGSTSWFNPSDERLKKNITTSTAGLSFINDLRPVTFQWKAEGEIPEGFRGYVEGSTTPLQNSLTNHGFIAQEVKTAIDAHGEIEDGFEMWDVGSDDRQKLAPAALIPVLVKAIQELSAKVTALESE